MNTSSPPALHPLSKDGESTSLFLWLLILHRFSTCAFCYFPSFCGLVKKDSAEQWGQQPHPNAFSFSPTLSTDRPMSSLPPAMLFSRLRTRMSKCTLLHSFQ